MKRLLFALGCALGLTVSVAPLQADLTTNLIEWWSFDEASGSRAGSHGSHTLTDVNTVTTATAKVGANAALFTRANQEHLTRADEADLSLGANQDWSLCTWVYLNENDTQTIVSKHTGGTSAEFFFVYRGGGTQQWEIQVYSSTGFGGVTTLRYTTGTPSGATWYFVCVTYNATSDVLSISENAGTAVTTTHAGGVVDEGGTWDVGDDGFDDFLGARLDEMVFAKRAWDSTVISCLYNSGSGRSYSDAVASCDVSGAAPPKRLLLLGVGE